MSASQGVPVATLQHALTVLADEGLIVLRQGRTAVVAGEATPDRRSPRTPRARDHDCKRAGCQPHACKPMTAKTIRNIHSLLSGAFATAKRWEWIAWNPAESAKPPADTRRPVAATPPEDVAKVIAEGRKTSPAMALYLWLVAITGARRGELCALQVGDTDLEKGIIHIAFSYVVVGGRRVRKDTKTHQDRYLAIDPVTCAMIRKHLDAIRAELRGLSLELPRDAYVLKTTYGRQPVESWTGLPTKPATWRPRPGSSSASRACDITRRRSVVAGPLPTCATPPLAIGHGSGGATTLRHYADPVSEVDPPELLPTLASLTAGPAEGATAEPATGTPVPCVPTGIDVEVVSTSLRHDPDALPRRYRGQAGWPGPPGVCAGPNASDPLSCAGMDLPFIRSTAPFAPRALAALIARVIALSACSLRWDYPARRSTRAAGSIPRS